MGVSGRLEPFGETIFTTITALANQHEAINLGQGFPNFDGPQFVKDAAERAMREGANQYPRPFGVPQLVKAIAKRFSADSGLEIDAMNHVTVTSGCTEALAATFLGLIEPGDEVVLIEPTYDAYRPDASMAGAIPKFVTLRPPEFRLDPDELRAAFSPQTRAIVVNTPHNPTGRVFDRDELQAIADLCHEFDAIAITDEVYEHMVYQGEHVSLASLDGMWDRTVTLSSLGKSFSLTGWKIGWAIGPEHLTEGVRAAHQFLTFATASPLQHGAAAALNAPNAYYFNLASDYKAKRDLLAGGLGAIGFKVSMPQGTYFMLADHTRFGFDNDVDFVKHLIEKAGVAAIPPSAFYHRPEDGATLVRFAFCKDEATLRAAIERLAALDA